MIALPICAPLQRVVLVDRAISLRDTTKFITVTLRLFHKFIISLLFHRGWRQREGCRRQQCCAITSHSPEENTTQWQCSCAVRVWRWNIAEKCRRGLECKSVVVQLDDLKRFSLYLDQKAIYLRALNKSCPLTCHTDN